MLGLTVWPLALPAQSVAPVMVQTIANTNFTLLISGNGTVTPNPKTFLEGKPCTLNAIAGNGSVFSNWFSNGTVVAATSRYTFVVESNLLLQANFVTNPFIPVEGTYHGLFYVTSNATEQSSGSIVVTLSSKGGFAAGLRLGAQNHAFSGEFSVTGLASKAIPRAGLSPITVQLQLDLSNGPLTGTISDGAWTADLAAVRAIYSKTNPAPQAGKYTLLIPGSENASAQPGGNGFGAVTVNASGQVTFSGILGDGTPVTSGSIVSSQGQWPFYISLYGGQGSILGWLSFTNEGDISGQLGWFKLPQTKARLYPGGFTNGTDVIGSVYAYTNGLPVLGLTDGQLCLTNGNLAQSITNDPATNRLTFKTASGLFKGSVMNPETGKPISVNGIVLQNQDFGAGYFLGTTESGSVVLAASGAAGPNIASHAAGTSNTTTNVSPPVPTYVKTNFFSVTALAPDVPLGSWLFGSSDDTNYLGGPLMADVSLVPDWGGAAVAMTNSNPGGGLMYNVVATNGQTNINCANGTIRFWFQPNWSTGSPNAPTSGRLFQVGSADTGIWDLDVENIGTNNGAMMVFFTGSNQFFQGYFQTGAINGAPINFQSNHWYQITLAYSPTNVALYTNGALFATGNMPPTLATTNGVEWLLSAGNGISFYPSLSAQASGFGFGNFNGNWPVLGQLADLETFNNALTPQAVAAGFPTFAGATTNVMLDSDYDGRSDLLETLVDGTDPNNPASVVQCRLGYWRFDSTTLITEQGQPPLSYNDISLAPSWSGTALNINSDPASQVTYWDVFTNGWANINCRQGSLRFWFKPNASGGQGGPFVYMGSTNGQDEWELVLNSGGSSISFITGSNGVATPNLTADCKLSPGNWTQIVLTYGSNGSSLYLNGSLAANGSAVTYWPSLANRNLGMVIGNNTACNSSINGQFDEIETFNYQLDPSNILNNFQIFQAVDSDLDGIPDLLEDIVLPVSRPFLAAPVVITGTIEAEQFDMGGPGIAYQNMASNPASSYRPTGMFITNCDDLGLGYCLDQTRAGEWVQYTINVLVAQTYTIETRVEGIETNGVFQCEFTDTGFSTNTGPLTITTTNWTNVSAAVYLTNGAYTMKLHFLANGTDGQHVGRFNYISIYPWWQPGFTSTHTNNVLQTQLSANNDFIDASNNAAVIQQAIDTLPASGGTVLLPAGTYYVSQAAPNETNSPIDNAAITIATNNVELAGAGKTNTTLIAYNRATTVISMGNGWQAAYTNFTLRDMTIEAQPHLAVVNVTNTTFEQGELLPAQYLTGVLTDFRGVWPALNCNLLFSNCQFLYADVAIGLLCFDVNCLVTHCDFNMWGGTNVYTGATNSAPTNTSNTVGYYGSVGVFCGGSPSCNISILENTYNGNTNLAPSTNNPFGYVSTKDSEAPAPDGFVWFQSGGNIFVARNTIMNYSLEGIQMSAGPNAVVGNTYYSLINDPSCVALAANCGGFQALLGTNAVNYCNCFIGNLVYGGQCGVVVMGQETLPMYSVNVSGNYFTLYPPFPDSYPPGSLAVDWNCTRLNVFGNTLATGPRGVTFGANCGNAVIMNNNFANVTYCGIGYNSGVGSLQSASIFNNILGQGSTFHVQLPYADSFGWFLSQNECLNAANNIVPPFLDPIGSAVHISN